MRAKVNGYSYCEPGKSIIEWINEYYCAYSTSSPTDFLCVKELRYQTIKTF